MQDLQAFPWPWEDNSVAEIHTSHLVEHLPNLIGFIDECFRILKPGGLLEVRHPNCKSERAFQDPTHVRFIPGATWYYFTKAWRDANKLSHYPIKSDFSVEIIFGDGIHPNVAARNAEYQQMAATHYWEAYADIVAKLRKPAE